MLNIYITCTEVNEVVAKTLASPVTSTSTHGGATVSPPEAPVLPTIHLPLEVLHQVERHLLVILSDITLILPMEVSIFMSQVRKQMNQMIPESVVEDLMSKFAAQLLITFVYIMKSYFVNHIFVLYIMYAVK